MRHPSGPDALETSVAALATVAQGNGAKESRRGRMLASPFAFRRGAALIGATDRAGHLCGWTPARAHARGGDPVGDCQAFKGAIDDGTLRARNGRMIA